VRALPPASRDRLGALNPPPTFEPPPPASRPPAAGAREAPVVASSVAAVVPEATDREDSPPARGEDYWRSRAASVLSALEAAEKRVKYLEERGARASPLVPGPTLAACQAGVQAGLGESAIALRDRSRNVVTCDDEVLRQQAAHRAQDELSSARADLEGARAALADLQEEARRAGALPGWLR
jgi:hypothetical protein